jgi:vancomycin resistance protein YoaR
MNPEVQQSQLKNKPISVLIISLAVFSLIMILLAAQFIFAILNYNNVYKGVYIEGVHVGNLTESQVVSLLKNEFKTAPQEVVFTLKAGDTVKKFSLEEISAEYDLESVAASAYNIGRTGNPFNRLYSIYNAGRKNISLTLPVSYDEKALENIINSLYKEVHKDVKEADLLIEEDKVVARSGHSGKSFDKAEVFSQVDLLVRRFESAEVEIPVQITSPGRIDVDEFYNTINREPVNASFEVKNNKLITIPHTRGRKIEKQELAAALSELENTENTEKLLPVQFTLPEITLEKLEGMLFKDTLGAMSTSFNTSTENNKNRAENIKLASSKIFGKIMAPGDVFSFNDVVGKRTVEGGYKAAHAYIGGKVIDDVGGGICQVSSTLYNAVLFSELEVLERNSHMFTVGYVPLGRDATVSYGGPDFKFRNSTNWPIKIEGSVSDSNKLYFEIKGIKQNHSMKVEFISKTISTIDFETIYIDDPEMLEGESYVKQAGQPGYVVETYKIVKENGNKVSERKLHTSTYKPLTMEIVRGTKKAPPTQDIPVIPEPPPDENQVNEDLPEENDPPEENEGSSDEQTVRLPDRQVFNPDDQI